jgi:ABC-type oligopeptide transport system ATPase subunit
MYSRSAAESTLALSFFRFVEASGGKISLDGVDISKIGLSDLRSRVTIVPQDPYVKLSPVTRDRSSPDACPLVFCSTILSGTLRSTLDVFGQYDDAEIYEALRRVHLIPSNDGSETTVEVDEDGDEVRPPCPADSGQNAYRSCGSYFDRSTRTSSRVSIPTLPRAVTISPMGKSSCSVRLASPSSPIFLQRSALLTD